MLQCKTIETYIFPRVQQNPKYETKDGACAKTLQSIKKNLSQNHTIKRLTIASQIIFYSSIYNGRTEQLKDPLHNEINISVVKQEDDIPCNVVFIFNNS